jgi:hypothetical protein
MSILSGLPGYVPCADALRKPPKLRQLPRLRVYIAGPISRGPLVENVNRATAAFVELAKAGLAPFCPHWSAFSSGCEDIGGNRVSAVGTVAGHPSMAHADWIGVDLPWVAVSDAVLRLPGDSVGADAEVAHAIRHGVPVFHKAGDVVFWARGRAEQ